MGTIRKSEIHRRRQRQKKLMKLRKRYLSSQISKEKEKILAKVEKIAPQLIKIEDFLRSFKS